MKKFLSIAILSFLSFTVKAQVQSLEFVNRTTCTVFVQIHADVANACGSGQVSALITINPMSTLTFGDASGIPGLGLAAGDYFYNAEVWEENPNLATTCFARNSIFIGPCNPAPITMPNYMTDFTGCLGFCSAINVSYNSGAMPHPQIEFN